MKIVLDTDAFSAIARGHPPAVNRLLALDPGDVLVPQPLVAELGYGLSRLPRSRRRADLERRIGALLRATSRAQWTDEVSSRFGAIKADLERRGERVDDFDLAIAAHALVLDAILGTGNVRHFARVTDLRIEDWMVPPEE